MSDRLKELYFKVIENEPENTYFRKCGFVACDNFKDKPDAKFKILITGMNPAKPISPVDQSDEKGLGEYVPTDSYHNPFRTEPRMKYFKDFWDIIPENFRDKTAYFDIFPFYEYSQRTLEERIKKRTQTMARILEVTQNEIEKIKPKLIIIANYSSGAYWGIDKNCCWMGYRFNRIMPEGLDEFEVFKVEKSMRSDEDRINKKLETTQLDGCLVVRYHHKSQDGKKAKLIEDDCRKLLALCDID